MKHLLTLVLLLLSGCSNKTYSRWTTFDTQGRVTAEGVDASLTNCLTKTDASDIIAASDNNKRVLVVGKIIQQSDAVSGGVMDWLWKFFGLEVGP